MVLVLNYGNAVTGNQRFSRKELETRLMRTLSAGAGVKMFGLRRIGKSTLRLLAMEQLAAAKRPVIFVDGQGLGSLNDFVGKIVQALPKDAGLFPKIVSAISAAPLKATIEALAAGTNQQDNVLAAYWQLASDAIRTSLNQESVKPVLIVDEFTYLISNMLHGSEAGRPDVDRLLASMREWRAAGMTMLLTGSIGLVALSRQFDLNMEHLNDLQPFSVPELTEEEARSFITQATENSGGRWTTSHTDEFLRQTGVLYPCFIVRGLIEIGIDTPPPVNELGDIFSERVRPNLHADFYNQFSRRFQAYEKLRRDEQKLLILPTLKAIMETSPCAQRDIPCEAPFTGLDLATSLEMLSEDGFVHFTENQNGDRLWKPASRLAAQWWKRANLA